MENESCDIHAVNCANETPIVLASGFGFHKIVQYLQTKLGAIPLDSTIATKKMLFLLHQVPVSNLTWKPKDFFQTPPWSLEKDSLYSNQRLLKGDLESIIFKEACEPFEVNGN